MSGAKNTCGLVVDYNLLAGKGKATSVKQNGALKDDSKFELNTNDKMASASKGKLSNKVVGSQNNAEKHERNIFNDMMVDGTSSKFVESNMASMEREDADPEISLNKKVRKQIIGTVKDNKTGNIIPVVLEELVDGTKPKKISNKSAHKPGMSGDGSNPLDLSGDKNTSESEKTFSGKMETRVLRSSSKRKQKKVDSDLEIVEELSGDSDGIKFNKSTMGSKVELSLKTSIDTSEDDLDSDLDRQRVLVMKNGQERKDADAVTNKLKNVQKRGIKRSEKIMKKKIVKKLWKWVQQLKKVSLAGL